MTSPPLIHLYVNPTGYCNLACKHCWITPRRSGSPFTVRERLKEEFTPEQFRDLLDQAVDLGLKNLKLTGGEPLLRSDFPILYRAAAEHSAGLYVNIETNGTLEPEGIWEAFDEHPPGSVAVSLDSVQPDTHDEFRNTPGAWKRTVAFIGKLVELKINTQIIMSTADFRIEPVLEMAAFCKNAGVNSLKINPVQPVGRGRELKTPESGMKRILEFAKAVLSNCGNSVILDMPQAFLPLNRLPLAGRCPIHNLLGILADGGISFCGIGFFCSELVMGNFLKESLNSVWEDSYLLKKLRRELPADLQGICGNCIHKNSCLGKCVMQNYYSCGSLNAPFWMCEQAESEGLFPKTRKIDPNA